MQVSVVYANELARRYNPAMAYFQPPFLAGRSATRASSLYPGDREHAETGPPSSNGNLFSEADAKKGYGYAVLTKTTKNLDEIKAPLPEENQ